MISQKKCYYKVYQNFRQKLPEKYPSCKLVFFIDMNTYTYTYSRGTKEEQVKIPGFILKRSGISIGAIKKHVEFPWIFIFDHGIFRGCNTIFQNFQK